MASDITVTTKITLYVDTEQHTKLKIAAAKSNKTLSQIVNTLLKSYNEKQLIELKIK